MSECMICGADAAELLQEVLPYRVGRGREPVEIEQEFYRCAECGEDTFTPAQVDAVQKRAAAAVREREGLLQPEEIRSLRQRWSLTQSDLESLIGAGPKTVVRWERGTVFQQKSTDSLLRVLLAVPSALRYLAARNGVTLTPVASQAHQFVVEFAERLRVIDDVFTPGWEQFRAGGLRGAIIQVGHERAVS